MLWSCFFVMCSLLVFITYLCFFVMCFFVMCSLLVFISARHSPTLQDATRTSPEHATPTSQTWVALLVYVTLRVRGGLVCLCFRMLCQGSSYFATSFATLKNTRVRQVVLDKWLPLKAAGPALRRLECWPASPAPPRSRGDAVFSYLYALFHCLLYC